MAVSAWDPAAVRGVLGTLAQQGREVVLGSGVRGDDITCSYTVDMRHVGQGHEISVALPELDPGDGSFVKQLLERFYAAYAALYGRTVSGADAEVITWRVRASGPRGHVTASNMRGEAKAVRNPRKGSRPVFFAEVGKFVDTPVYDHYALAPGVVVQGPAIVEQRESTVVVGPNASASLDENYNLIMLLG